MSYSSHYHLVQDGVQIAETRRKIGKEEIEDEQKNLDDRTVLEMRKMANTISPIIQTEEDYPSKNQDFFVVEYYLLEYTSMK